MNHEEHEAQFFEAVLRQARERLSAQQDTLRLLFDRAKDANNALSGRSNNSAHSVRHTTSNESCAFFRRLAGVDGGGRCGVGNPSVAGIR
jgi:hypothetical protein